MTDFRGAFTAILTPFDERGEIDLGYVGKHLRYQEEGGIDGVIPCGTNGEGPSLSLDERKRMIEFVVRNKGSMLVIAGTGCSSLVETVELTSFASRAGADAVLVVPPYFFKGLDIRGLIDYYRRVLDAASIPALLYNIPWLSGVEIADDLLRALSGTGNLAGVKDTSGDIERTMAYVRGFPDLAILNGDDRNIAQALAAGAVGTISGLANVFPGAIAGLYDDCRAGVDVAEQQRRIKVAKEIIERYPRLAANKSALALRGFPLAHVRPPLVDLTDGQRRHFETELREVSL